jgi:hypothetical protein
LPLAFVLVSCVAYVLLSRKKEHISLKRQLTFNRLHGLYPRK